MTSRQNKNFPDPIAQPSVETRENEDIWRREYRNLLEKWEKKGALNLLPKEDERRDFPRFKLKTDTIDIQLETRFPVVNLSRSGLCFNSSFRIEVGERIRLVLEKTFLVEVEIISVVDEPDPLVRERYPNRVYCCFTHPEHGLQMLVMLDEMKHLEVDLDPLSYPPKGVVHS